MTAEPPNVCLFTQRFIGLERISWNQPMSSKKAFGVEPRPGQCRKSYNPQINQEKVLTLIKKYKKSELLTEYLLIKSLKGGEE